ncbi:hydrogenase maturation protease [Clostridium chromiireducens]|uniref:Hydrogenase 2 maturation protease n=1 Tax=Clostridium chromiireducens TaxID=225345 RepID=A0A1V4ILC5_9CLOT|nr:hydrogenase maturation protease [Clostridium chromiireducens]OPJ60703.1 hydrogenase 2 maturation protease [Clostridium chromiireducens]
MEKVTVLGIGNLLLKDDGIGIHVIDHLKELEYDSNYNVELIDGGTCILDLLDVFMQNERIIVLDSIKGGHEPGTIYKLTPEELGTYIKSTTSLHDVQVLDILRDAKYLGFDPEVVIIGIEPEEITFDLELSPMIKGTIPKIIDVINEELNIEIA